MLVGSGLLVNSIPKVTLIVEKSNMQTQLGKNLRGF